MVVQDDHENPLGHQSRHQHNYPTLLGEIGEIEFDFLLIMGFFPILFPVLGKKEPDLKSPVLYSSQPESFYELYEWLDIVRKNTKNIPIILIENRQNNEEQLAFDKNDPKFKELLTFPFFQVNPKSELTINDAFLHLSELCIDYGKEQKIIKPQTEQQEISTINNTIYCNYRSRTD